MLRKIGFFLWLCSLLQPAIAVEPYPERPITFVIPYPKNSDTDAFGRLLAKHVGAGLNNHLPVFENQTGESGLTAAISVKNAKPDGYTLLIARVGTHAILPALAAKRPFEQDEFTTLSIISTNAMICAVHAHSPYKTTRELLAAMRENPGRLKFSTSGSGTIQNLAAKYLLSLAGLKPDSAEALHVTSGAGATEALVNQRVDFTCNNANTMIPSIQSGKLRGLFTTSAARLTQLPKLLSAREAGLRDMQQIQGWTALMGPAKLPAEITAKWKTIFAKLAKDPAWISGNIELGAYSALLSVRDPEKFVRDQYALYDQLVTTQGLRQ